MLSGKVRAAVSWLSESGRGRVLQASDLVETTNEHGNLSKSSVYEVLNRKHPDSQFPPKSAFLRCDELPRVEDVEVSGSYIMCVAQSIQGSAGPGGCDASHWQDSILH